MLWACDGGNPKHGLSVEVMLLEPSTGKFTTPLTDDVWESVCGEFEHSTPPEKKFIDIHRVLIKYYKKQKQNNLNFRYRPTIQFDTIVG